MKKIVYPVILVFLCFVWLSGKNTQTAFDKAEKKAVIDTLCENLEREYIFPEITEKYVSMLKQNFRSGKYDGIGQPEDFARTITADLMEVHRDRHLSLQFNPEWVKNEKGRKELDEEAILLQKRRVRVRNYGFQEIKILPGNIGYFRFKRTNRKESDHVI